MNKEEIQTCFSKLLEEEATMNKALEDAGWIRSVDPSLHWLRADTRLGLVMFYKAGNPPYYYSSRGGGYKFPTIDYCEDDLEWYSSDSNTDQIANGLGAESLKKHLEESK